MQKDPQRIANELHIITEVAKELTAHIDLSKQLDAIMDRILQILEPVDFGLLLLWNTDEGRFRPQVAVGQGLEDLEAVRGEIDRLLGERE